MMASSRLSPKEGKWDVLDVGCLHGLAALRGDALTDGVLQGRAGLESLASGTLGRAFALGAN